MQRRQQSLGHRGKGWWCSWALTVLLAPLAAVESNYLPVERVIDGDSLVVLGSIPGPNGQQAAPIAVRLLQVNAPEMRGNDGQPVPAGAAARGFVQGILPPGSKVRLWGPGDAWEADGHGRLLAVVVLSDGSVLQERIIQAGWSAYWQRYGRVAEPTWDRAWQQVAAEARAAGRGMWELDPRWMRRQAAVQPSATQR